MLLFAPIVILVLTLAALGASNMQRGFRSSWLVALAGGSFAWISLLILRFQLPQSLSFPFWWVGDELEYSMTFVLDSLSWPLAFAASSLLVAWLLGQVREAVMASWVTWAPGLAIGAAGLLAAVSGDLLTFLLTWTLIDVLVTAFQLSHLRGAAERQIVLQQVPIMFLATFLLLAAWIFSFYGQAFAAILVFVSASLRLGIWTPRINFLRPDSTAVMMLIPLAAGLALLVRSGAVSEPTRSIFMLLLLLPAVYAAGTYLLAADKDEAAHWELGQACLVAVAALGGQTQAAVAFSVLLLLGRGLVPIVQRARRLRLLVAVLALLLMSGLPMTAGYWGSGMYTNWSSPVVFAFIPIQAALLAGWMRRAVHTPESAPSAEPWMRTIQWIGFATLPIVFIFFGLGLLPSFAAEDPVLPWWPAAIVLAAAAAFYLLFRRGQRRFHPSANFAFEWIFSLRWLQVLAAILAQEITRSLNFLSSLLEGPAGVLWALLFMALLLSLASQFGLGS